MPTLREAISNRGKPPSAVRTAVRADLKAARRRLYSATRAIDAILGIDDDDELVERATPIIEAVRRIPDAA